MGSEAEFGVRQIEAAIANGLGSDENGMPILPFYPQAAPFTAGGTFSQLLKKIPNSFHQLDILDRMCDKSCVALFDRSCSNQ